MLGGIETGEAALLVAAGVFLLGALIFYIAGRRRRPLAGSDDTIDFGPLVRQAFTEARAIVDLTTPVGDDLVSTPSLTATRSRIDHLDARLRKLATQLSTEERLTEAIADLRRAGDSLGSALEAERAQRLGAVQRNSDDRSASLSRIAERSAELNLAADELMWLAETGYG